MIGRAFLHYVAFLSGVAEPQSQTTASERDLLSEFLKGRKRIVEVGVFEGFTTRVLVQRSDPGAIVYGVDLFPAGRFGVCWGELIARGHNKQHLVSGKLKLVRSLSTRVGDKVPDQVDYVFIDGDHSLQGIAEDWAFWSDRLAGGGVVALHDVLPIPKVPEMGSHRYFRSHIQHDPQFKIVAQRDSLSVLEKRQGFS